MMLNMRDLPIKVKLIMMMSITAGVGVLFMAFIISINEAISKHDMIQTELSTLADVIGSRSTGSLTFNDPRTALENLNALSVNQNVVYAVIFQENGQVFAEYKRHAASKVNFQQTPFSFTQWFKTFSMGILANTIDISKAIFLEDQRIGKIKIVYSLNQFYINLIKYLCWIGLIVFACFGLGLVVSTRLHKLISTPVLELNLAANRVSEENDYSIRVKSNRDDELGKLIDSFNNMLEQIEIRNQKLADYSNQLETQVKDRTDELLQVNERRIQWLENMAGFLKHELKNSTVGIKSSLELIERRAQACSIDVYLERAKKSLSFMDSLLDSISNASSIEATVYKETLVPIDLTAFIRSLVNEYRSFYPQYRLIDNYDSNVVILGNETRLKQLMDKLVSNAFEHSYSNSPILINVKKHGGWAELSVIDEGINLPEDKQRIFDLFVSLSDAEHRRNDSMGLGLYLVKLISESHGGSVAAIDREDKNGAILRVKILLLKV